MRADRLVSIMLMLKTRGRLTVRTLATELEVSERTIYRDIEALSYAGVPIITQPGTGGGVFLDEDYQLALDTLSQEEMQTLFLTWQSGPLEALGLESTLRDALLKLFATLNEGQRNHIQDVRQRIHIDPTGWFQLSLKHPHLEPLQQAIEACRAVHLDYRRSTGEPVSYTVHPHGLVARGNAWYLVAERPASGMRTYRISRIRHLRRLEQPFSRNSTFDLAAYWQRASQQYERQYWNEGELYRIKLRVHYHVLWMLEGLPTEHLAEADEWVTMWVDTSSEWHARSLLLQLSTAAVILEPAALRDHMTDYLQTLLTWHRTTE